MTRMPRAAQNSRTLAALKCLRFRVQSYVRLPVRGGVEDCIVGGIGENDGLDYHGINHVRRIG
jgi:hypothetical protein